LAQAQLVGLPQQVDGLGDRTIGRVERGSSSSSAMRRSLTSTERRLASVGCAVKTGRALIRANPSATSAAVTPPDSSAARMTAPASARGPPPAARAAVCARARCTCSAMLARWKYNENARASVVASASGSVSMSAAASSGESRDRDRICSTVS
jgi:hypothetical protein